MVREQSDPRTEGSELAIGGVMSFGKNQYAVATIYTLACVGEAFEKACLARQREKIQQGDARRPFHPVIRSPEESSVGSRSTQNLQRFTVRRRSETMAQPRGQRRLDEANIHVGNVIADDQYRTIHVPQMV